MNRVLFVDDEPRVLAGLRRMLRSRQGVWEMHFAEGVATALEIMDREPADVIVSDFRMPGLDGAQLLAEVRRRHPDTARLILSGQTAERDMMRVVTIAHQFLAKPCEPDEVMTAVDRALRPRDELKGERLRAELACISALPSRPSALRDLREALERADCDVRTVAAILGQDVALTAKVLQLVNSSFFAPRSRVTSLEVAVARLGIHTIRSLVLMDEVVRGFQVPDGVSCDWLELLNDHALQTALLARRLAAPGAQDDAFCAGLLHECGQLVLAACRPDIFSAHRRLREQHARSPAAIETETFGATHAQVGAYFLSLWGFPLEIVESAAHHDWGAIPGIGGPLAGPEAVRLAHRLVESERIRLCSAPGEPGVPDAMLESVGVLDEVRAWRAEAPARSQQRVA